MIFILCLIPDSEFDHSRTSLVRQGGIDLQVQSQFDFEIDW